jgi:predicted permease
MDIAVLIRERLNALGATAADAELVDELVTDLNDRFDDRRRAGLGEKEASAAILAELDDPAILTRLRTERATRRRRPPAPPAEHTSSWLAGTARDVSYAVRVLRRSPGFLLTSVLTLAVGIGALSAIVAVVQAVLLTPLPYPDAHRLLVIWETDRDSGTVREPGSIPDFLDLRARSRSLDGLGGFAAGEATLGNPSGEPLRIATLEVTSGLLPLVGVHPIAGRTFTEAEYKSGASSVIISDRLWARQFQRAPAALGHVLTIDDRPWTIVGVAPDAADVGFLQWLAAADYGRGFADRDVRSRVDAWVPLALDPKALPRDTHPLLMLGRAAPGATAAQVQQETAAIMADLEKAYPENKARGTHVEALTTVIVGPVRPALRILLVAVVLVLLLAVVNVANLALVRGRGRLREAAVRSALGASVRRLVRQLVIEHVVLGMCAAIAAVAVAWVTLRALVLLAPADVPRLAQATLDPWLLAGGVLVSALIGALVGCVPAFQVTRADLAAALGEDGGRSGTDSTRSLATRQLLVAVEIALAVMLAVGAGLMIRTLSRLDGINPGFTPDGVLKAEFQLPESRYPRSFKTWPNFAEMHRFNEALIGDIRALPGVQGVALAGNHPLDAGFTNSFTVIGREAEARHWPEIAVRRVTPGYFAALHVPLVEGRLIGDGDIAAAPPVLLVNEAAAERFFPHQDPIGQQIGFWGIARRVIGVVGNERFHGIAEAAPPAVYAPLDQTPSITGSEVLLVRAAVDPGALATAIRGRIARLDPALAIFGVEELRATLEESLGRRRFVMLLLTLFAGLAIGLASIGIHGVLSYDVAARRREFGIRLALGARPSDVMRDVLGRAARTTILGLAAGTIGALAVTRLLTSLLFGVAPTDAWSFLAAALLLAAVALAASLAPARQAVSADPATTLREG